jgi:hypothetical protein
MFTATGVRAVHEALRPTQHLDAVEVARREQAVEVGRDLRRAASAARTPSMINVVR